MYYLTHVAMRSLKSVTLWQSCIVAQIRAPADISTFAFNRSNYHNRSALCTLCSTIAIALLIQRQQVKIGRLQCYIAHMRKRQ